MEEETSVAKGAGENVDSLSTCASAVLLAARILLEGGSGTALVEDTASALGESFLSVDECTIFVIHTGIMVSVVSDSETITRIAHTSSVSHNIWAVDQVIDLEQRCLTTPMAAQEVMARLKSI